MIKITNTRELNEAIRLRMLSREAEWISLEEEYRNTCEKLTVPNLIKRAFTSTGSETDHKPGLISTAIGVTSGIIAKKLVVGKTFNPFSKLLGIILEVFVAHKVTKNAGEIKEMGNMILEKITGQTKPAERP